MRIPGGEQFGQVVARPGPLVQTSAEDMGAGLGKGLEQAGGAAINYGMDLINKQNREKALADQEAKANAKEAARVKALTATAEVRNGLRSYQSQLENGLNDGTVDKSELDSKWAEGSTKMVDDAIAKVDPAHQELVRATLLDDMGTGQANVRKLAVARDKKDILTGGLSYIEQMQRFAATGGKEADQAIANVKTFWTATGPMAGEDPAKASERVQKFAEGVRLNQATNLVHTDPAAALKALKNPDYLPELTPEARTSLVNSADAAVLRGQQRVALQSEANMRKLDTEWKAAQSVLDAGKTFTPEYAASLATKFKGTPYAAALNSMISESPAKAAFVTTPLPAQDATLADLQNKMNQGGATPEMIAKYKKLEAANKATKADIKADPYMAAAERGVITELTPLSMDLNALPAQLAKRAESGRVVSQWAGQEVSLFRPDEADKIGGVLQAMPPKDRAGALAGLSKAMTPGQMVALGKQLGSKDDTLAAATMMAANGFKTTGGRLVSEIALTGADAMKENRVKFPSGQDKTTLRAEFDKATRGAYLSEDAQRAAGDAAMAVFAGLLTEGQSPDVGQAVRLATGGIMDLNGSKFVKPYGWDDSRVTETLRKVTAPTITKITKGQKMMVSGQEITPEALAQHMPDAVLGPSPRSGNYTISVGGRLVTNEAGKPLLLPLGGM
jgi:hypothetical protein